MKILERTALILFSSIILILSCLMCLMIFKWANTNFVINTLNYVLESNTISNIVLGCCTVLILLAIKCIFFDNSMHDEYNSNDGILLKNENGSLLITKDTLENLATSVIKNFDAVENSNAKAIIDKEGLVKIDVVLFVHQDTILKELSNNIQLKIKEAIKRSLDVELSEVNIRVKNIAPKKTNTQEQ